jgi:hypothetical protein
MKFEKMDILDETTRYYLSAKNLIIRKNTDYLIPVIFFFVFVSLLVAQLFIWSIIPLVVLVLTALFHSDTCFDFEHKQVYTGHYLYKLRFYKGSIVKFHTIDKILIKGSTNKDGDGDMYKPFWYEYYLLVKDTKVDLGFYVETLPGVKKLNMIIAENISWLDFEIDESEIREGKRMWFGSDMDKR